jgi:hypothetical protein
MKHDSASELIIEVWPLKLVARGEEAVRIVARPACLLVYAKAARTVVLTALVLAALML